MKIEIQSVTTIILGYKMFRRLLTIFFILPILLVAQYEWPGSTDGQFLKIGVSPRGTALSDSYIAMVEGVEGTYYNSSALAWLEGTDIVFNHTVWFAGINHDFAAVARSFGNYGSFGISAIGLYTDEMKVRTPLQPNGTGETFYSGNYKIGLTYSRFFLDRVTIGGTVSLIHLSLYGDFTATTFAFDIATMYKSDFRGFTFAMQMANFGSNIKFVNESYPLPTSFTFGACINVIELDSQKFIYSFTAVKPNDGSPTMQMGGEWNYDDSLFLRGGYYFNHSTASYSFGAGFKIKISDYQLRTDYSYNDYNLLGASHRFGLGVNIN